MFYMKLYTPRIPRLFALKPFKKKKIHSCVSLNFILHAKHFVVGHYHCFLKFKSVM